jgi:hypothetical protein
VFRTKLTTYAFLLAFAFALPTASMGQDGRLKVKVVGGRLVASCRVSSDTASLPVNLFISYDRLCGLELHNQATKPLKVEFPDGRTKPISINLPGIDIEVPGREHGDEDFLNKFTKAYSEELEEVAVVGTIGANVLSNYFVTFDVGNGRMSVTEPKESTLDRPEGSAAKYIRAAVTSQLVWLPVTLQGKFKRVLAIGSADYDSIVDVDLCDELEQPGGTIGDVLVGGLNFSEIIPWRPEDYTLVHLDGALGTLGINFLENYKVSIDRVNSWVGLTKVGNRPFPTEERDFFVARAEEEAEPVSEWLKQHYATRLGGEAADLLLQSYVDDGASDEDVNAAIEWVGKTRLKKLLATQSIEVVKMLMESARFNSAVEAGRVGLKGGREDRYPESVHRLHAMMGQVLLDTNRDREAWEHLMSAAFGLNEAIGEADQARVNLLLGRYYEKIKRYNRALSRYVQAVVTPEAGPQAIKALIGLQEKMGGETFSVDLVEKLIAGKVRNMTAPTKFVEDKLTATNRCVLVEHVINPHLGGKAKGMWRAFTEGGSMVFEGLRTHFPTDRVAMISYHVPMPKPIAIMNEVSMAAGDRTNGRPAFMIDGQPVMAGALEYYKADAAYGKAKNAVKRRLALPSDYDILIDAKIENGKITGKAVIEGPKEYGVRIQVLVAEKGVLYPGMGATVVHKMVARASLTKELGGQRYESVEGGMTVDFERSVTDIVKANRLFLEAYEKKNNVDATRLSVDMDHDQLVLLVVIRNNSSNAVLQAAEFDLSPQEKSSK